MDPKNLKPMELLHGLVVADGNAPAKLETILRQSQSSPSRVRCALTIPCDDDRRALVAEFRLEMN
jgi:hypothetical protein